MRYFELPSSFTRLAPFSGLEFDSSPDGLVYVLGYGFPTTSQLWKWNPFTERWGQLGFPAQLGDSAQMKVIDQDNILISVQNLGGYLQSCLCGISSGSSENTPSTIREFPALHRSILVTRDDQRQFFYTCRDMQSLFVLDLVQRTWNTLPSVGSSMRPERRAGFAMIYSQGKLMFFGGSAAEFFPLSNIPVFDLGNNCWSNMPTCQSVTDGYPLARADCGSFVRDGEVFIVGGKAENGDPLYDVWKLDLDGRMWEKLVVQLPMPLAVHQVSFDGTNVWGFVANGFLAETPKLVCWRLEPGRLVHLCMEQLAKLNLSRDKLEPVLPRQVLPLLML